MQEIRYYFRVESVPSGETKITVGAGKMNFKVPTRVGYTLEYDLRVGNITVDGKYFRDLWRWGRYVSPNFDTSDISLTIYVTVGMVVLILKIVRKMIKGKDQNRYLFGFVVVLIGVFLFIKQVGIISPLADNLWTLFIKFWPLLLLFLGIKLYITNNRITGGIILLLSVSFLFNTLLDFNFFSVLWPILIIGIGVSLLFKEERKEEKKVKDDTSYLSQTLLFKDENLKVDSQNFKGGRLDMFVGSLKLDLRKAKVSKVVLN